MGKVFLIKYNGAFSYEKYAVCRKTIFGREYMSRYTGFWYSDTSILKNYCRMTKEQAYVIFERETGKKLEDTY